MMWPRMPYMFRVKLFVPILIVILSGALQAQPDDAGCKDHPLLSRLPGFYIDSCESEEFAAHEFTAGDEKTIAVEGGKTMIKYVATSNARKVSELQVLRNYVNAVKQAGGGIVWSNDRAAKATARFAAAGRETWLEIRAYDQGEAYNLLFIEKKAMVQEVTAADMLAALNRDGRVALYIQFDFAKAKIKPESAPILDQMAALLKGNPALKASVEGHTDNVGSAASNQSLSEERAKAVVAALVQQGVEAGRLSAAGHGMSKPIADNSTEEGRAKNRRVELVRK